MAKAANRLTWYSSSTPSCTAPAATTTPASSSPQIQRGGAAATASTPSTMKTMTSVVPRSGCSMISAIGTAVSDSTSSTSVSRGTSSASRFSPRIIAMPTTIATLANSDGWIWNPAGSTIQECAPLIVAPIGDSTTTSPRHESTYTTGAYARSAR